MGLPGKGGRAQRAKYQCKSKRIPIDLEAQIDQLIRLYLNWLDVPDSYVMPNWVLHPKQKEDLTPTPIATRQEWDEYLEAIDDDEDIDDDWEAAITRITPPPPEPLAPVIQLTPSQEDALTKLQVFIAVGTEKYFRLTGYAGTGKSFLICEFMRWLRANKLNFIAASPTNKASKNLAKLATAAKLTVDVTTVAKLLGQQPHLDETTGIEEFLIEEGKDLNRYDVIVLDEFSMISKGNFEQIQNAVPGKTKLIFIGDAAQLPPVNEKEPIVMALPMEGATLSEVVRYDGAIARVAEQIRSEPQYNRVMYPFVSSDDGTIVCKNREGWLAEAGKLFKSAEFKANPDYCRFLVWRNNTADKLNAWVRSQLWGEDVAPYVIGDRLIAKKPVFRETTSFTRKRTKKKEWTIVMANSEECVVSAAPELTLFCHFPK